MALRTICNGSKFILTLFLITTIITFIDLANGYEIHGINIYTYLKNSLTKFFNYQLTEFTKNSPTEYGK